MRVSLPNVSASQAGDYYQVLFEDESRSTRAYVLIQRQFEDWDDGVCFIETHDPYYLGHVKVRRASLNKDLLCVQLCREEDSELGVVFRATGRRYDEVARILKVMIPSIEITDATNAC